LTHKKKKHQTFPLKISIMPIPSNKKKKKKESSQIRELPQSAVKAPSVHKTIRLINHSLLITGTHRIQFRRTATI